MIRVRFVLMTFLIPLYGLIATPATAQNTWFVDDDTCPGVGDGSNLNPFCSIQDAIDAASDTDEIIVAIGTYLEAIDFLGKAITVRSTDPADPTVVNATIICGTVNGSLHIVSCVNGEGPDTVLAGFTIRSGNANSLVFPDDAGGGMLNLNSSPTVICCAFFSNSADKGGGAMYNEGGAPQVSGCDFFFNSCGTGDGGAIWNDNATPEFTNCLIRWNVAADRGGGMFNDNGSNAVINDCVFERNEAGNAGGGMANLNSSPTLTGCTLVANTHPAIGGAAIYNDGSAPVIAECVITSNGAGGPGMGSIGGGIINTNGVSCAIVNSTICGNSATQVLDFGAPPFTDGGGNIIEQLCLPPKGLIATGGCCLDGVCVTLSAADCGLVGGTYQGDDTDCASVICPAACLSDINGDGSVNVTDLLALLAAWGVCP